MDDHDDDNDAKMPPEFARQMLSGSVESVVYHLRMLQRTIEVDVRVFGDSGRVPRALYEIPAESLGRMRHWAGIGRVPTHALSPAFDKLHSNLRAAARFARAPSWIRSIVPETSRSRLIERLGRVARDLDAYLEKNPVPDNASDKK